MRVLPDRIHRLRLISREISRVVRSGENEAILLGEIFVHFDGTPSATAGIEEVDDRPVLLYRVF
jgi:hypothetical protein